MVNALVVDDGAIFDASVLAYLDSALVQMYFVADVVEALNLLQSAKIDILLLATHLDQRNLCRRLRSAPATVRLPIITLSIIDDLEEKLRYYQMGIDDFLSIPFDGRELAARIHAVLRRAEQRNRQLAILSAAGGAVELDIQKKTAVVDGVELHLTRLEYLLLYHLIQLAGNYVSTEELLEMVWGYNDGTGDPALVRAQIKNLRRKLQTANLQLSWLRSMPGLGYQVAA